MKSRRQFLKTAGIAVAAGLIAPQLLSSCGGGSTPAATAGQAAVTTKNIGLQLYSLRDMVNDEGIAAVLKKVAAMGFKNLETASYSDGKVYGMDPLELKKIVDDLGMRMTSAHIGKDYVKEKEAEIMSWWDQAIDTHNKLGVKYIIQPWMHVDDNTKLDYIKTYCDYFNTIGLKTAASSIAFGYHNHAFEFKKIDDQIIYDFMLKNTSPNHVLFELDVYWAMVGGYNPVDYMKNYASQIRVLHIKDEKELGSTGKMDFKAIFDQAYANNIKDWYVEVEQYTNNNPVESVQQSFDLLNSADYVK